jgi:YVTN family beta-propeller protein
MKSLLRPLRLVACVVGDTTDYAVTATTRSPITTSWLTNVMLCCPRRLVLGLICWLSALFIANNAQAALGDIVAEYSFPASSLVMSPTQSLMYATIPSQNSIAIINTNTLAVESTVFVGSGSVNLAFSPDGSKAYIANSTSNFVVVFDTQTRTVIDSFLLSEHPQDVVFGSLNRLWVLGETQVFQIDATTGASTGPSITGFIYSGSLEISPDRNTLYYGDYGVSPSTMYKYDVSGTTPVLVLQTPFGTVGSNGQDLTLSHNGNFICYATGSGQNGYQIAKFRTSDFATLGSFNTGPYPRQVTFSQDDQVVYAVHTAGEINVFDANTFLSLGTILGSGQASELTVDSTNRYLFAGYTNSLWGFVGTRVYDISPLPEPHLDNISTRAFVQTGDNVMIGGFIVHGIQPKRVIIRAIGPELTQYGVPNPMADPTLELHNGTGALIGRNDNWQTTIIGGIITHDQVAEIQNSGHAPGDLRESAIIADLPPGNYTAILRGVNNTTGVALVEAYDLDASAPSILGNISTRSFVQTGDDVMIGGFIVQGTNQPKRVIVRAIGPELTQYGVPNPLADPTLELHDGTGALIASNDDWQHTIIGGIITADQVAEIQNSGHVPGDPRESAIIANLPPGNYTAIVRGVSNTTGVALVEVYDLGP